MVLPIYSTTNFDVAFQQEPLNLSETFKNQVIFVWIDIDVTCPDFLIEIKSNFPDSANIYLIMCQLILSFQNFFHQLMFDISLFAALIWSNIHIISLVQMILAYDTHCENYIQIDSSLIEDSCFMYLAPVILVFMHAEMIFKSLLLY